MGHGAERHPDAPALEGSIIADTISPPNMTLTNGSSFTGTVNIVGNARAAMPSAITRSSPSAAAVSGPSPESAPSPAL